MRDVLFEAGAAVFFGIETGLEAFHALFETLRAGHPGSVIRLLDGEQCRTALGFFDEIARKLEFPSDRVGWNILNDRMWDLTWLPASSYLLLIDRAPLFLIDEHESALRNWYRIMAEDVERNFTPGCRVTPRNVLLQCAPGELAAMQERWRRAGGEVKALDGLD